MRVQEICSMVDDLAPPGLAYEWDRCGLSVGHPEAQVSCVMVALTVTRAAMLEAEKKGAQMIVSHHPLIWEPLKSLRMDHPGTALCVDLAKAGVACYSAHTNLDLTAGGVNDVLAARLGLEDTVPLLPARHVAQVKLVTFVPPSHLDAVRDAVCSAGAGIIGEYSHCSFSTPGIGTFTPGAEATPHSGQKDSLNREDEIRLEVLLSVPRLAGVLAAMKTAHPYEEVAYDLVSLGNTDSSVGLGVRGSLSKETTLETFAAFVRKALGVPHVRIVGRRGRPVHTVGVIGGSGGGDISSIGKDVDVFVTGDVKYHDAQDAVERDLAVIDAGHAGTEKCIVPVLAAHLRKHTKGVRVVTHREPELFSVHIK